MEIISIVLAAIAVIISIIGLVLSNWQYKKDEKKNKAELLKVIIEGINSKEAGTVFYKIEYEENWYNKEFHNTEEERNLDHFLTILSYSCYLFKNDVMNKEEWKYVCYYVERTLKSEDIKYYLFNVYHYAKKEGIEDEKFVLSDLLEFAKTEKHYDDSFFDKNSYPDKHFLNF